MSSVTIELDNHNDEPETGTQDVDAEPADVQSLIMGLLYEAGIDGVEERELLMALRIDAKTAGAEVPSLDDIHQAIRALAATGTIEPAGRTGFRFSAREWAWTLLGQIEYLVSDAGERKILAQRFRRTLAGRGR